MGCGSSSLKGDHPTGLSGDDAPQPIRKVKTNFSTIDYDQSTSGDKKRRMTEYAPEDTIRNKSETSATGAVLPPGSREGPGSEKLELEPYHTTQSKGIDGDGLAAVSYPHENQRPSGSRADDGGVDPTSEAAKDRFADANDPAHDAGKSGLTPPGEEGEGKKRKGSWLERLKDRREEISDEDMKKYTGKTKAEMKEYAETGPGVGARQNASHSVTAHAGGGSG